MSSYWGNIRQPTVVSKVDASGLTQQGLTASGILGLVGLSAAGTEDIVYYFTGIDQARNALQGGALLDTLRAFFAMGGLVAYVVRVGTPVAATKTLSGAVGVNVDAVTLTAKNKGTGGNNIQVKVETGALAGKTVTIRQNDGIVNVIETYENMATKAAFVTAVNASSNIVSALNDNAVDMLDNAAYANLSGGTNGSRSNQEISDGLELLLAVQSDLINLDDATSSYHALASAHVNEASNIQNRQERVAILGMPIGTSVSAYIAQAATLDKRCVLVAPCVETPDFGVDLSTTSLKNGHIGAALVAGLVASMPDPAEPLTMKQVKYATGLEFIYTNSEIDQLIDGKVLVIGQRPQGNVIIKQLTCSAESGFTELSVVRLIDFVMKDMRNYLERTFIGRKGVEAVTSLIITGLRGKLNQYIQDEIVYRFLNDSVTADFLDNDQTWINASFSAIPVMPVNNIGLTGAFSTIYNWNVSLSSAEA